MADEVATIIPNSDGPDGRPDHDLIVRLQGGGLKRVSHLHPSYAPLHYVLLFPRGDPGFHPLIPSNPGPHDKKRSQNVMQRRYTIYRLHPRRKERELQNLFHGGRLLQQYIVDA
jgi:hypothetical protein